MSMNKVPSLIIGIGGIGCRIAAGISDLLSEEDREYVGVIGMDTNINDLKTIESHKVKTIQTSDDRKVIDYLNLNPQYLSWFPANKFTVGRGMLNGAGQIRSISRLAAIAAEESGRFTPIREEIKRIRKQKGEATNGNLTVMIVGSITGGTGAGLFIQLPYYIRQIMKNTVGLESIIIRGMFLGPDITADVQPSKINRNAVRVNGYACLKELNALYMTQYSDNNNLDFEYYEHRNLKEERDNEAQIKGRLNQALSDAFYPEDSFNLDITPEDTGVIAQKSPNIPYDYLYLIEGTTLSGDVGNASIGTIENQVSRMVFTLLFTPVVENALSVEDNMVLQDMETGGMNRYSSAGMCRLVYPNALAKDYVTMALTRDLVKDEWLLIETSYQEEVKDAKDRQKTDSRVEIPRLPRSYRDIFAAKVKDGTFGKFFKEAFIEGENGVQIPRSQKFLRVISDMVDEVLESDEVQDAKAPCEVTDEKFRKFEDATSEVFRVDAAVSEYMTFAKNIIKTKEGQIANELFPVSTTSLAFRKNNDNCIYNWLYNVHPITARFLIYDLIVTLEEQIEELDSEFLGINLNDYLDEDYDPKEEGVQSADAAIRKIQESKMPFFGNFKDDAKRLHRVKIKYKSVMEGQVDLIDDYIRVGLLLSISRTMLKRLDMLAENYRVFFQSIKDTIEANNERIEQLEHLEMPLGQIGVYCSKEAFRKMAEEYRLNGVNDLPDETKKAIFEELFRVFANDYSNRTGSLTERQKELYAIERKKVLASVFQKAVIDTIRTDVSKNDAGIVDLNIRQALLKEMELKNNIFKDFADDYDKLADEYIREKIQSALYAAAPMLAVDSSTMADNTETVYLAVNPDFAVLSEGKPNASATADLYVPQANEATDYIRPTVLVDEEFSPYEIICFKARYKFSIEDLIKYRNGTENERAYAERIRSLDREPAGVNDPNAGMTVVNPHICKYWHEEGFLPAISSADRRRAHTDLLKAFVYSMGYDLFVREMDENILDENNKGRLVWMLLAPGGAVPVKSRGQVIGNSYANLFAALPFNGRIKKYILLYAEAKRHRTKGYADVEQLYENILSDSFVEDLIQRSEEKLSNDDNILDIFVEMRDYMPVSEWKELFTGLIEALWEYTAYLFDYHEKKVNTAVGEILKQILYYSVPGRKTRNKEPLSANEKRAVEQMEYLFRQRYRK